MKKRKTVSIGEAVGVASREALGKRKLEGDLDRIAEMLLREELLLEDLWQPFTRALRDNPADFAGWLVDKLEVALRPVEERRRFIRRGADLA